MRSGFPLRSAAFGSALLAIAVALAGCGDKAPGAGHQSGSTTAPTASSTAASPPLAELTKRAPCEPPKHVVRAGRRRIVAFHPVAAVLCKYEERRIPDQGEWTVSVRGATRAGIDRLVDALDRPDERQPKNVACALVYIGPSPVSLIDAGGNYLFPRFPLDQCRQPQRQVLNLIDAMKWQTISVRRVRQQFTPEELASHCSPSWKNEIYLDARFHVASGPGGPVLTRRPQEQLHACLFRTRARERDVGDFVRNVDLDAADSKQMRAALSGAGPTGSCPVQREFAVISGRSGDWVDVELGGCWRVQRDGAHMSIGGADAVTVSRLLSLH